MISLPYDPEAAEALAAVLKAPILQVIEPAPVIAHHFRTEVIYTLGLRSIYDPYIAAQGRYACKGLGGSVWRTKEDAQAYLDGVHVPDFAIYGVYARWDEDTKPNTEGGTWHDLTRDAALKAL